MEILFLMENLYPPKGGAEKSIIALIGQLKSRGIGVGEYYNNNDEKRLSYEGHHLIDKIERCDVVVSQLKWAYYAVVLAKKYNKKSIVFVRSYEGFCGVNSDSYTLSLCEQQCGICAFKNKDIPSPDLFVTNSRYMGKYLRDNFRQESKTIYPFIDLDDFFVGSVRRPEYITMNQFSYHKGAPVFLAVAERMPHLKFKIVGYKKFPNIGGLPANMEYVGLQDPAAIYEDALVFLHPALWNEPFGRTVIEAQLNGIPTIASAHGAPAVDNLVPRELLVGKYRDAKAWAEKIDDVVNDYERYSDLVRRQDLAEFDLSLNVNRFVEIVEELQARNA